MPDLYLALLLAVIAINLVAAAAGGLDWYRNRVSIGFWYLLRAAQLATLAFVLGECVLYVTGALSILFGILVLARPGAGSLTIVYMIAAWAIIIGALKLAFAFRIRKLPGELESRFSLRP